MNYTMSVALTVFFFGITFGTTTINALDSRIIYSGRTQTITSGEVQFDWSGVSFEFGFTGTKR